MPYVKGSTIGDVPSDVCACRLGNLCDCLDKLPANGDDKTLELKCDDGRPVIGLPVCQDTISTSWTATNATSILTGTTPNLSPTFRVGDRVCNDAGETGAPEMLCFPAATQCDVTINFGPVKVIGKTGGERLVAGYEVQTYKGPTGGPYTLVATNYDVAVDSDLPTGGIHTYTPVQRCGSVFCQPGESIGICVIPVAMTDTAFSGNLVQFVGGNFKIRCLTMPGC